MESLFVPYELALLAKEKGFNEPCIAGYDEWNEEGKMELARIVNEMGVLSGVRNSDIVVTVTAPLYQQLIDWFREKHGLHIWVYQFRKKQCGFVIYNDGVQLQTPFFKTTDYYSALTAALKHAFTLI